jgi:hypothetical protein
MHFLELMGTQLRHKRALMAASGFDEAHLTLVRRLY